MHLARLKADLKHKISQQDEASDKISPQDEASDKISQELEASEVPQDIPSGSISFHFGARKDEKSSQPKGLTDETVNLEGKAAIGKLSDVVQVLNLLRNSSTAVWDAVVSLSDKIGHQEDMTDISEKLLFLKDRYNAHDRAIRNLESYLINHVLGSQADFREHLKALQDDLVDLNKRFLEQGDIRNLHADISALKRHMDNLNKLMISCFLTANAGKPTSQEKHLTKPYQVAVVCKEAKSLADQATCLREDIREYNATGISQAGETEPMLWFNDRLTALETARAELIDRLSGLGIDVREATAISQLYITPLLKAFEGLGDEVMSLGSDSTTSPEDHTQSDGK